MKKLVLFLVLILVCLFSFAQGDTTTVTAVTDTSFLKLLGGYWSELLLGVMAVVKIVVRITPSIKDDKVFGWLDSLIELLIPNITSKKTDK